MPNTIQATGARDMEKIVEKRSETSQQPIAGDSKVQRHPNTLYATSVIGMGTYILSDLHSFIGADLTFSISPV